jgi:hypothetical protein
MSVNCTVNGTVPDVMPALKSAAGFFWQPVIARHAASKALPKTHNFLFTANSPALPIHSVSIHGERGDINGL